MNTSVSIYFGLQPITKTLGCVSNIKRNNQNYHRTNKLSPKTLLYI